MKYLKGILYFIIINTITLNVINNTGLFYNLSKKDMHIGHNVYKLYNSYTDSKLGINPIDSCDVSITDYKSDRELYLWLNNAIYHPNHFKIEYLKYL